MKKISILCIILAFSVNLRADEGMWLLPLLEKMNISTMNDMGLKLSAEEIYSVNNSSLKDAIVVFGGGCTGEMISSEGLLLTNHHCGRSNIQYHTTKDHDYMTEGFWAMNRDEELPNPGLSVKFLVKMEEVTEQMRKDVTSSMTKEEQAKKEKENYDAIIKLEKEANSNAGNSHYRVSVKDFYAGNVYYMLTYEVFTDVRLVGAPPHSIGNFGSDTDNWMWPRHTADFSMFRVYANKDGKPAKYSKDNVPYKPKHHLPVSIKGVQPNDFAMILGNPGGTQRFNSSFWIADVLKYEHPNRVKIRTLRLNTMMSCMEESADIRRKYQSKYSSVSNYWKNSQGQIEALTKLKVYDSKVEGEKQFTAWVNKDQDRVAKYGNALATIEKSIAGAAKGNSANQYLAECVIQGCEALYRPELLELMGLLSSDDKEKGNELALSLIDDLDGFYKDYDQETDKKITTALFELYYKDVPAEYHPSFFQVIEKKYKGDIAAYVEKMYSKSQLINRDEYTAFLKNPSAKVLKKDLFVQTLLSTFSSYRDVADATAQYKADLQVGREQYVAGMMAMKEDIGLPLYPDANFTMRLTYGKVGGYNPRDAVSYNYYTTLKGVMEKQIEGDWEFDVDDKLEALYEAKDYGKYGEGDVMKNCFITDNDITGGNSGSPVINGNGELIGIAFDGNWEAMSGDVVFEHQLQRCINTDIRYILFVIDKFAGATHLIDEMDIVE